MKNKAQDGRRKYSEIADKALKLFLENGYEATSMRMIASGVGCEPGLIYYYFRNKDEAFEKAFEGFSTASPASVIRTAVRRSRMPRFTRSSGAFQEKLCVFARNTESGSTGR